MLKWDITRSFCIDCTSIMIDRDDDLIFCGGKSPIGRYANSRTDLNGVPVIEGIIVMRGNDDGFDVASFGNYGVCHEFTD